MTPAGERTWPVTIEKRDAADAVDGSGAPTDPNWSTLCQTAWMKRVSATGQERFEAAQESAPVRTVWELNYRPDMDPDRVTDFTKVRRLKFNGRIYDITFGEVMGLNEGISLDTLARQG